MSDINDQGDKSGRGTIARPGKSSTLTLNRTVDAGHVRQSFSHGRSKPVVVEVRKKRTIASPGAPEDAPAESVFAPAAPATAAPPRPAPAQPAAAPARKPASTVARTLSEDERDARVKALGAARAREAEDRQKAEEDSKRRALLDAQLKREQEEQVRQKADQERERVKAAALAEQQVPDGDNAKPADHAASAAQPQRKSDDARPATRPPSKADASKDAAARVDLAVAAPTEEQRRVAGAAAKRLERQEPEDEEVRKVGPLGVKKAPPQRIPVKKAAVDDRRARGRLTIVNALDDQQRERSLSALKRRREREKAKLSGQLTSRDKIQREVTIPEVITIGELSNRMAERSVDIIKYLMKEGEMKLITDVIDVILLNLWCVNLAISPSACRKPTSKRVSGTLRPPTMSIRRRARRSSPSWAMSTMAKRRCSTPSARPMSCRAKRAASPSISALTRSPHLTATRSRSSTPRVTRRLLPCVLGAPR